MYSGGKMLSIQVGLYVEGKATVFARPSLRR
jgi:hypothetical protein